MLFRKKSIIVGAYMKGRLGNQMFQYAFAKVLRIAQGETGQLVFNFKKVYVENKVSDGFEDSLKYFNVEPYIIDNGNLVLKYGDILQRIVYMAYVLYHRLLHSNRKEDCWLSTLRKVGVLYSRWWDNPHIYEYFLNNQIRHRIICRYSGVFNNAIFFDHIKPILLEDFTPKEKPLQSNRFLYDIIENSNSVCVSVRRGDYLSNQYKDDFYVCDKNYFQKAIKIIKQKIEQPVLVFFSDDIEWVKENITTDLPAYYESGNDPVWEKIRLMYSCKHYVISNSTFSWWAQYLSRNDSKIVISPDRWYNNDYHNSSCHLLMKDFIKVS